MDLELGLKLRRVADEFSSADFQFSKDRTGPVFISTETDSMFFLKAYLKGHRKQNIKIEINEDGTRIIIGGEKAIQETIMVGWQLYKKETEIRRFRKAFKIPDGVILDKIKAGYNEDESILTILMPKKEKGIRGFNIEEVKEQELAREGSETLEIVPDEVPKQENAMREKDQEEAEAEHAEGSGLSEEEYSEVPEIVTGEELNEAGFNVAPPEETQVAEVPDMKENQPDQNERLKKPSEDHEGTVEEAKSSPHVTNGEGSRKSPANHLPTGETSQRESVMQAQELEKKEKSQGIEGDTERNHEQPERLTEVKDQNHHKRDQVDGKESGTREEAEDSAPVKPPDEEPLTEVTDQNHHKRDQVDGKESGTREEIEESAPVKPPDEEPLTEVTDQNHHKLDQVDGKESGTQEGGEESALVKPPDEVQEGRQSGIEKDRGRCKMCTPILAGSSLLLSLVVVAIQFIRKKGQQGKRKE